MRSLKAIEVYRDKIQIATYKVTDDGQFTLVSREKLLNAKMELKEIVIKEDETGMEEWRYTLVVTDLKDGQRHTIVRKPPLNEVARWLAGTTLASVASKNTLESALQQILNILRDYYNIRKIYESESFKFYVDINSNKYTHNAAKFFNQVYSVEDTRDYRERITDDDVRKFLETLSAIKDDKIFFVSVGAMISALFNNEKNIKRPLIWLWSPAVSIGKSTLATLLTTKAWGIKKLSASEAESAFRMLKLLSVGGTYLYQLTTL
ncbi:hypothetical protein [Thermococcus sp. JCM 11816]|uniref:hypothetical protein n=1 Tax=Thermococcus sp. (strain JCM 11816 / KS-1) TaxID=1295125 RepID=UPI0006D03CDD